MPRNLHSFCASNLHTCQESCTVGHAFPGKAVPHLAYWNGMVEIKTRGPRWNNAERQSARRVTCRLSHGRSSKQRHGFRSSKTSPLVPTLIVSPPVYSHTAFLDDFFWRAFPYTQAEATRILRTCGESSPLSPRYLLCVLRISTCLQTACARPSSCAKGGLTCRHRFMGAVPGSRVHYSGKTFEPRCMSSTVSKKDWPEEGNR